MSGAKSHLIPSNEFEKGIPEALAPSWLLPLGKYLLRLWVLTGPTPRAWEHTVLVLANEPMIGSRRGPEQYEAKHLVHISARVRWPDGETSAVCHIGHTGFWTDSHGETDTVVGYFLAAPDVFVEDPES